MRSVQFWQKADFFRRIPKDLTEATATGAIISIACVVVMVLLFAGEVISFVFPRMQTDLIVKASKDFGTRMRVNMDMSFISLPCALLSVDILDVLHNHEMNSMRNLVRTPLDKSGRAISDGRNAGQFVSKDEGCRVVGYIEVSKVPGNFHISAHGLQGVMHQNQIQSINTEHVIHHLSFGNAQSRGEHFAPLDGSSALSPIPQLYRYYVDIIPTEVSGMFSSMETYQFTSTLSRSTIPISTHAHDHGILSTVFFQYQLSPITVRYSSARVSFTHFLTYVCAIVGGVYTMAGLLSRFIYTSTAQIRKRFMGKGD